MKRYFLIFLIFAAPGFAQATIFWDDELEAGTGSPYDSLVQIGVAEYDTNVKVTGNASIKYHYGPECLANIPGQTPCGGFSDRNFAPTDNKWTRFYVRLSNDFQVHPVGTKGMRSDTNGPNSNWWMIGIWGEPQFAVGVQNSPVLGSTQNVYSGYYFSLGEWYCIEMHEKLNDPGQANGIIEAWIDGDKYIDRTDIQYRQAGDNALFYNNRMYRQGGQGNIWYDRVAVADQRIGCGEVPPPVVDPPAPSPSCGDGTCGASETCSSCVNDCGGCPTAEKPGAVVDLTVADVFANSVELAFTEVDDGTGAPAKYDIRLASPTMSWGTASAVGGSCASPLVGNQIGQTKTCTVANLVPNTSYQFQLVSYRGTLNQDAVFGALSNVAAKTTTQQGIPPPAPNAPPPDDSNSNGQGEITCQESADRTTCDASGTVGGCVNISSSTRLVLFVPLIFLMRRRIGRHLPQT